MRPQQQAVDALIKAWDTLLESPSRDQLHRADLWVEIAGKFITLDRATRPAAEAGVPEPAGRDWRQVTPNAIIQRDEAEACLASLTGALFALASSWEDQAERGREGPQDDVLIRKVQSDTLTICARQLREAIAHGGQG